MISLRKKPGGVGVSSTETLTFTVEVPQIISWLWFRGRSWRLALHTGGGIAVVLVILLDLRRDAHHLHDVIVGRLQAHGKLHSHPGFCIHLGVVNGHGQLQAIVVYAMEALLHAHGLARRTAGLVGQALLRRLPADGL